MIVRLALIASLLAAVPAAAQPASDVIVQIRVHGNHTTPDAIVLALVALEVGAPATDAALEAAQARVEQSGRFAAVEVRRRMASLTDPAQIMVVVMVTERAGVSEDDLTPGLIRRIRAAGLWLPVLTYEDGHGVTYGARATFVDLFGPRTRVSMPLTWGGERRASAEAERTFASGPISRVVATGGVSRRVNPFDEIADTRVGLTLRAEHAFQTWVRIGGHVRRERVSFEGRGQDLSAFGMDFIVDTRIDPSFPRNAVYTLLTFERMAFSDAFASTRWTLDARGYLGLPGSSVLAVSGQATRADQPLPRYEKALLGGATNLRGTPAGMAAGDSLAAISAELRVPITSPLSVGRFGVKAFVDAGAVWNVRESMTDQPFRRGVGAGVFFGVAALTMNVDVGRSEGQTRWHAGLGLAF